MWTMFKPYIRNNVVYLKFKYYEKNNWHRNHPNKSKIKTTNNIDFWCISFRDSPDSKINWKLGHSKNVFEPKKCISGETNLLAKKHSLASLLPSFSFLKVSSVYNQNGRQRLKNSRAAQYLFDRRLSKSQSSLKGHGDVQIESAC